MRRIIFTLIAVFIVSASFSQAVVVPRETLADSTLGWIKVYNFPPATKPVLRDDRTYSVRQLSICNEFANWIQASYMPKGSLGDVKKAALDKLTPYNQIKKALPQSYGAYALSYISLKRNQQGRLEPYDATSFNWSIYANGEIGDYVDVICTPEQYYFYIPGENESENMQSDGYLADARKLFDYSRHPVLKNYIYYYQPKGIRTSPMFVVLLCKDNKLPYVQITKGEYLDQLAGAIERKYGNDIEEVKKNWEEGKTRDKVLLETADKHLQVVAIFNENKEKYKNRLQEKATVYTEQPNEFLSEGVDLFEGTGNSSYKYPIYKYDPAKAALTKTDQPQWIVISWDLEGSNLSEPYLKHMHESIISNFNFDYVYNYFFYPEKVKGQSYKPLRSPLFKEEVVAVEASVAAKKAIADNSVYFFDDFSTTGIGKKPTGWNSKLNDKGIPVIVTTLNGETGNWLEIKGNSVLLSSVKKPLPKNFTLSFDVAVPENFTWGAKSLKINLSRQKPDGTDEASVILSIKPGYSGGTDGSAYVETKLPAGYSSGGSFVAPGFSVNKKINRISVAIKKNGEQLEIWIDKNKVAEYSKGVPDDLVFNALSFSMIRSDGETEKYFVSNIKITKD